MAERSMNNFRAVISFQEPVNSLQIAKREDI